MRKAPFVIAVGLYISVAVFCADFWQLKDPGEWSEKELAKIRESSPWAHGVPQVKQVTTTGEKTTGTGKNQKTKTVKNKQEVNVAPVLIRWESAPALLTATERADPKLFKAYEQLAPDHYLVSVTGMTGGGSDLNAVIDELQSRSALHLGDRIVRPKMVRALDSGHGPFYLFQFARDGTFESFTKSIELRVHLGKTRVETSFEPKKMVFQGKLSL